MRQLREEVPFEFVAQIDLAEAALHPVARDLPAKGRLLVFVDMALLMADPEGEPGTCRIIHDATPAEACAPAAIPKQFEEMEAWWRTPNPQTASEFEAQAKHLESMGMKDVAASVRAVAQQAAAPDPSLRKPFVYPARPMRLVPILVAPDAASLDCMADGALQKLLEDEAAKELYDRLTSNDAGSFTADPGDMRVTQSWLMREARRNRLLGPPEPEQRDPRFDAIPKSEVPPPPWTAEQQAARMRKADEWRFLLQVSVADLSQENNAEGTLYFMLRKDDLARADFSRATVCYQQT